MDKKIFYSILLIFLINIAVSSTVIVQSNKNDTTLIEMASYTEDYLFMGKSLNFSGEAEDLVFLGKSLDFSGKTKLGLIGGGKKILVTGTVNNGIISGCQDMVIEGNVTGTNFIGCKNLYISEEAHINGDLFAGCGNITIDGPIHGKLYVGAGKITINSEIDSDVKVYGGRIIIGKNGKINGNLTYGTKEKLSDEELSRVSGDIVFDESKKIDSDKSFLAIFSTFVMIMKFLFLLSFVVIGVILLFLPAFRKLETTFTPKTFWHTALWGLIPIFMYPAVIVLSLVMVITIPFAVHLLLAFLPLFLVAFVIGTTKVGQFLVMKFKWNVKKRHYNFLIGALAYALLSIIPFIDFLTVVLFSSLGWGVFISFLFNKKINDTK